MFHRKKLVLLLIVLALLLAAFSVPALAAKADFDFEEAIRSWEERGDYYNSDYMEEYLYIDQPEPIVVDKRPDDTLYLSSDESIVKVDSDGTVTGLKEGVAFVLVDYGTGEMYSRFVVKCTVEMDPRLERSKEEAFEDFIGAFFGFIALLLYVALIIAILVPGFLLSHNSTGRKSLPSKKQTSRTVRPSEHDPEKRYFYEIPINGHITAGKLQKEVNEWLSENPYAYDCKIHLDYSRPFVRLISLFVFCKFYVKKAVIEYSLSSEEQKEQYGLQFLYKFWFFGPLGYSDEKLIQEWKRKNPDSTLISQKGGKIQHLGFGSGFFFAQYYSFAFFKRS